MGKDSTSRVKRPHVLDSYIDGLREAGRGLVLSDLLRVTKRTLYCF